EPPRPPRHRPRREAPADTAEEDGGGREGGGRAVPRESLTASRSRLAARAVRMAVFLGAESRTNYNHSFLRMDGRKPPRTALAPLPPGGGTRACQVRRAPRAILLASALALAP